MSLWFTGLFIPPRDFLFDYVVHLDYTLFKSASKLEARFKKLPGVIAELDSLSEMYKKYSEEVFDYAKKNNAKPEDVSRDYDFPDDNQW